MEIQTKELERVALAGLLQCNEVIPDVMAFIKPEIFAEKVHQVLFNLIITAYQQIGKVDEILLVTHAKSLGISNIYDIDIYSYVEVLRNTPVNTDLIVSEYYRELYKFFILRRTYRALGECQKYITHNRSKSISEVIPELDKKLQEAVTLESESEVEFHDIFGEMEGLIKDRAEIEGDFCILSGFDIFDRWYGGFPYGSLNIFAAPSKVGKSTWLLALARNAVTIAKNNCKCLFIDTELENHDVTFRAASSITGVNEWYYRTGNFKKNKNFVSKSEEAWEYGNKMRGLVTHAYVADKGIDKVTSIIRRWHAKYVKKGEAALVIVDYLKLGSDEGSIEEWQQMGIKTNALKKLATALPMTSIVSAVQTNEQGGVAQSARIKWFASNVYKLERKTPEMISEHGERFGTHTLSEIVIRNQGQEAHGANNLVKCENADGRPFYKQNYINYDCTNFKVSEKGTLQTIMESTAGQLQPEEDPYKKLDF